MEFSLGYAGVTFFYVLSGFILTYNYEPNFKSRVCWNEVRSFWIARFARIYPAHVFAMLLALTVLLVMGGDHWDVGWNERLLEIGAQVVLLQSWFPSQNIHFGINGPAWSISVECFFYALFPLLLAALLRVFRNASPAIIMCFAAALWSSFVFSLIRVDAVFDQWNLYVFPPARLMDFTIGVLIALAFARRRSSTSLVDSTMLESAALAAFALAITATPYLPQSLRFSAAFVPCAALLIYVFAAGGGNVSRLLSSPGCVRLGEASYAFYLIHLSVIHVTEHVLGEERRIAAWLLALVGAVGASLLIFAYVETPARQRIRKIRERIRADSPPLQNYPNAREGAPVARGIRWKDTV